MIASLSQTCKRNNLVPPCCPIPIVRYHQMTSWSAHKTIKQQPHWRKFLKCLGLKMKSEKKLGSTISLLSNQKLFKSNQKLRPYWSNQNQLCQLTFHQNLKGKNSEIKLLRDFKSVSNLSKSSKIWWKPNKFMCPFSKRLKSGRVPVLISCKQGTKARLRPKNGRRRSMLFSNKSLRHRQDNLCIYLKFTSPQNF